MPKTATPASSSVTPRTILLLSLVLLPVLVSYAILFSQMRAIPMFDDYQALIFYSVHLEQLHGFIPKLLYAIAAQHDEYKLIFEHLVEAVQLSIVHHVAYRFLTAFGNLFVLAVLAVYWLEYFATEAIDRRLLRFLPIALLLFQLNYVETLDWAMCGLQIIPAIFFALAALHLLTRPRPIAFPLACLSAFLSCIASANGFLLAPVGLLFLIQTRAYRRIAAWVIASAIALPLYLYKYVRIYRVIVVPHPTVLQKIHYFLSFLGGAFENLHHIPFRGSSVLVGAILFAAFLYACWTRYDRQQPFAFYTAIWVMLCAAGVTQVRIHLGLETSLTLRYKVFSDMMLIFVYGLAVQRLDRPTVAASRKRLLYASALTVTVLLYVSSGYFGYRFLERRRERYAAEFALYRADPAHVSPETSISDDVLTGSEPEFARKIMNEAIAERIYIPPQNP